MVLAADRLPDRADFPGLKAIGRIAVERTTASGRTGPSIRYAALSRLPESGKLATLVRTHWSVENHLHWTPDIVFDEDDARTRKDNGPKNLALLRRLAQNIIRAHPLNRSIAGEMRKAAHNEDFFFDLLAHMR